MKKMNLVWILILVFLVGCQAKPSPEELILSQVDYVTNGDLDGMMALFADDIVFTLVGFYPEPEVHNGNAKVRAWLEGQFADNLALDIQVVSVDGDQVTTNTKFTSDFFRDLGIAWMECKEVYLVQGALITDWSCTMKEESMAAFELAINPPLTIAEIVGKWKWVGETYEAFFTYYEDNRYEFSRVVGDDEILYDSGQIQLEDGQITYNTGDDPKYCETGSQGIYGISMTDNDQMELILQEDPCSRRRPPVEGPNYFERLSQ